MANPKASAVPKALQAFLKRNKGAVMVASSNGNQGGDSWRPRPGEFVEGKVLEYKKKVGENKQDLISLDTGKGISTVWLSTVLRRQISPSDVGKRLFILFQGSTKPKKGRKYGAKLFSVAKSK